MLDADCPFAVDVLNALVAGGATVDRDRAREDGIGVPACSCKWFKHYAMCDHALAFLEQNKVVTSPPPTLDPTPTTRVKPVSVTPGTLPNRAPSKGGRAANARRGGALDKPAKAKRKV